MNYNELEQNINEGEIKEVKIKTWAPFKRTFVLKEKGKIYFTRRKKSPAFYLWHCANDKDYTII